MLRDNPTEDRLRLPPIILQEIKSYQIIVGIYAAVSCVLPLIMQFPARCLSDNSTLPHPVHRCDQGAQVVSASLFYRVGRLTFSTCQHDKSGKPLCYFARPPTAGNGSDEVSSGNISGPSCDTTSPQCLYPTGYRKNGGLEAVHLTRESPPLLVMRPYCPGPCSTHQGSAVDRRRAAIHARCSPPGCPVASHSAG